MSFEYAILVRNRTRLEMLEGKFNTKAQAKFYIGQSGGDFDDYEQEHVQFYRSLEQVQSLLSKVIKNKIITRDYLPSFLFNEKHMVVVVGQDGLVANAAKYVNGIPIVAVNPDSERYDGVLLPFSPVSFIDAVEQVMHGSHKSKTITLAEAKLNDGQRLLAFNDLFIGAATHVSARYRISFNGITENQSSSGIIISTRAGSSGWLSSVFNLSTGIQHFVQQQHSAEMFQQEAIHENENAGVAPQYSQQQTNIGQLIEQESVYVGETHAPQIPQKQENITLGNEQLMFVVREPFASKKTQTGLTAGILEGKTRLSVESVMPSNGVIFSDGIESDFLKFNSGAIAQIGTAKEKAQLIIPQ